MRQTIDAFQGCVAHSTLPASMASAVQLKTFSGELYDPSLTIGEFKNQFRTLTQALQWTEKQQIAMLLLFLHGHTREVFNGLSDRHKNSIKYLFEALGNLLHSHELEKYMAIQLRSRKLKTWDQVSIKLCCQY